MITRIRVEASSTDKVALKKELDTVVQTAKDLSGGVWDEEIFDSMPNREGGAWGYLIVKRPVSK